MNDDATEFVISERDFQLKRLEEIRTALADARASGNWDQVPRDVYRDYLGKIILTTAPSLAGNTAGREVALLTAEHFYSLDLAAPAMLSGQTAQAEARMQQASRRVLDKLREQALKANAGAVVALSLQHQLIETTETSKYFLVTATGTAIKP